VNDSDSGTAYLVSTCIRMKTW